MATSPLPSRGLQLVAPTRAPAKRSNRRRARRHDLIRPIVEQVPAIYMATGFDSERTANDLGISRSDVLDLWNQHQHRKGPGSAPFSAARPCLVKGAA